MEKISLIAMNMGPPTENQAARPDPKEDQGTQRQSGSGNDLFVAASPFIALLGYALIFFYPQRTPLDSVFGITWYIGIVGAVIGCISGLNIASEGENPRLSGRRVGLFVAASLLIAFIGIVIVSFLPDNPLSFLILQVAGILALVTVSTGFIGGLLMAYAKRQSIWVLTSIGSLGVALLFFLEFGNALGHMH